MSDTRQVNPRIELWRPMVRVPLQARIATLVSRRDLVASMVQSHRVRGDEQYASHYCSLLETLNRKISRLMDRWMILHPAE